MSATTRTVQQPLGIGQFGAALAVVALILIVALAVAFGSQVAPKTVAPAVPGAPPAVIDHGWSQASTSAAGAKSTPIDHGSSEGSMVITDTRGGFNGDMGLAPRAGYAGPSSTDIDGVDHGARDDFGTGTRVPGLRPQ
jgi:hypothetical protein